MPQLPIEQLAIKATHLQLLCQILREQVPNAEVWAYGSRVNGTSHEGSDLDLVVKGEVDLATLREQFQQSRLPMLIDLHQWESLPASFHQNIEKRYVVIQKEKR